MIKKYAGVIILSMFALLLFVPASQGAYALNLGSYPPTEAQDLHKQLALRGYPVYLLYGEKCEVRLGTFETMDAAESISQRLKNEDKIVARVVQEEDTDTSQFGWSSSADEPGTEVKQGMAGSYGDPNAQKIISLAIQLFGHPYKYGGTRIGKGIDCSYFVQSIFKKLGLSLPRTAREQINCGREVDIPDLKAGDLIFFKKTYYFRAKSKKRRARSITRVNHVGIFIGNGEFIHATINVKRVTISRLADKYYMDRFAGARRVLK
jgi:cell wall-associated NlpC family hydrolase